MRKTVLRLLLVVGIVCLVGAGTAYAIRLQVGKLIIVADGDFSPRALPKRTNVPIEFHGYSKISTTDDTRPSPLRKLVLEFDKHGAVETRGLAKCTMAKLVATTTKQARRSCGGAIVGTGFGTAIIEFPDSIPFMTSSPLTIFNGPVKGGNPTVFAHAHIDNPTPTTYVVPVEIEKVNNGRYGFRTEAKIPKIVNDYGSPIYGRLQIGRTWNYKGEKLGYANARCADGRLQARAEFTFKDGTLLAGSAFRPCKVDPSSP